MKLYYHYPADQQSLGFIDGYLASDKICSLTSSLVCSAEHYISFSIKYLVETKMRLKMCNLMLVGACDKFEIFTIPVCY